MICHISYDNVLIRCSIVMHEILCQGKFHGEEVIALNFSACLSERKVFKVTGEFSIKVFLHVKFMENLSSSEFSRDRRGSP